MQSKATSVKDYLASLPDDRRAAIAAIRETILANLDQDYEEGMQYGMIGYYVPHRVYPDGYHCDPKQPLPFASVASQKNHMAIYMSCIYGMPEERTWFEQAWKASGKKMPDMGKSCIRFRKLEDVPLDVIGEAVRRVPARAFIKFYDSVIKADGKRPSVRKKAATGKKKVAKKGKTKTATAGRRKKR